MCLRVPQQPSLIWEALFTHVTVKWIFTGVCHDMTGQCLFVLETLSTFLTFITLHIVTMLLHVAFQITFSAKGFATDSTFVGLYPSMSRCMDE